MLALAVGAPGADAPFTVTWTEGRCVVCKTAVELGRIQFVSRTEGWAVVHTTDGGRTWKEVRQTRQYAGDADGPPAFWFLDAERGWISWWAEDPKLIRTRDSGKHWESVSEQFLQRVRFFDENHGYGTEANNFLRTNDGGRTWTASEIAAIRFIERMLFLTPERGWLAGADGNSFSVFRTANGGHDWEVSRTTCPYHGSVRDLFFLDLERGWLTTWLRGIGETNLFRTLDGGKTWTPQREPSSQWKDRRATVVRFVSAERGFVFLDANEQHILAYTIDGGRHWHDQVLPRSVYDCQVFDGDILCSSGRTFEILTIHPQ